MITRPGCSFSASDFNALATASGSTATSVNTWIARSAPMASAVRSVSWQACGPQDTTTISVATPASFSRTASSTAISSKGFIDILTLAVSTPLPSALTRTLTLKSTTRLMATRTFMERKLYSRLLHVIADVLPAAVADLREARGARAEVVGLREPEARAAEEIGLAHERFKRLGEAVGGKVGAGLAR